jgi:hypothetical protein
MLGIADARFQPELAAAAKRAGKLEAEFVPPGVENLPRRLEQALAPFCAEGVFPEYPFGTDLTPVEQRLARGLRRLKTWSGSKPLLALRAAQGLFATPADDAQQEALARLGLARPRGVQERLYRALVLRALQARRSA